MYAVNPKYDRILDVTCYPSALTIDAAVDLAVVVVPAVGVPKVLEVVIQVTKTKPVVVMKSGRTEAGAKAASSHTGSIAGSSEAFSAAFQQTGVVEVNAINDLFDFSLTLSRIRGINGGIAIVTNSGGPGVMAADAIEEYRESRAKVSAPPPYFKVDRKAIANLIVHRAEKEAKESIGVDGFKLLEAYGIPVPSYGKAETAEESLGFANRIGYPVSLKIISPDIVHKTDVGCVKLNVRKEEVKETFFEIVRRAEKYTSARRIDGVLVQPVVVGGREVIVGMKRDTQFGPLILFGLGGIYVEVFKDVSFRIAPLSKDDAIEMIKSVKAYSMLKGVRGEPMSDIDSYMRISAGKDVVLVEGAGDYNIGKALELSDRDVSAALDLEILMAVKYTNDFVTERFLNPRGMELLGTLPYSPLLASLFVSEICDALNGEWLVKPEDDEIIAEFLIGAMSPPSALKYFRRVRQAALITGGDRADLQNLALETGNIKCILLTGHLEPPQTMLGKAEEKGIPVIIVADDTLTTIEKVDEIFGKARIRGDAKIGRIKELVEQFVDLNRLIEYLT